MGPTNSPLTATFSSAYSEGSLTTNGGHYVQEVFARATATTTTVTEEKSYLLTDFGTVEDNKIIFSTTVVGAQTRPPVSLVGQITDTTSISYGFTTEVDGAAYSHPADDDDASFSWGWHYPLPWWNIVQLVVACAGVIGNLLVILALRRRGSFTRSRSIDVFIGALSIADLMTSALVIPIPQPRNIPSSTLGAMYCKFIFTVYFAHTCTFVSVYTLMGIVVERVVAVLYPLRLKSIVTRRRVGVYLLVVWIVAPFTTMILPIVAVSRNNACESDVYGTVLSLVLPIARGACMLVIPAITILVSHIVIAVSLTRQRRKIRQNASTGNNPPTFHIAARNRILRIMFTMVAAFVLTFFPFFIAVGAYGVGLLPATFPGSNLHRGISVLFFAGSAVNPFIYMISSDKFRSAMNEVFTKTCTR